MSRWEHLFVDGEFTPRIRLLAGLTFGQVTMRPAGLPHSIYEELWHTAKWQSIVVRRDEAAATEWNTVGPQFPSEAPKSERMWTDLVNEFLVGAEKAAHWGGTPEALVKEVRPGVTLADALESLAVHNAYHLGKIVALRQVIGAWPPTKVRPMKVKQVFSAYDHQQSHQEQSGHFKFCPRCGERLRLRQMSDRERPWCPSCGFIQFRNPLPAVAVMITDGDRILLGKRSSKLEENRWCMPCGFIEHDEDFLTAARREVKEEIGLDVRPLELINVAFNFLNPTTHTLVPVLRAEVVGGALQAGDDLAEVAWFGPADPLPPLAFESDMYIIERYRRGLVQPMPVEG